MNARAEQITTLFVVRHGQSVMNNQRQVTGQLNPALSEKGVAQSQALARLLRGTALGAIYTSTLSRSVQTAAPTAREHGLQPLQLPALDEINMGVLQGRYRDERDAQGAALWRQWQSAMWRCQIPGAESFAQLHARVGAALRGICERHAGQSLLIVGHRAVNRIVLGILLNLPQEQWPSLRPSNKIVHRIRLRARRTIEQLEIALKNEENNNVRAEFVDAVT